MGAHGEHDGLTCAPFGRWRIRSLFRWAPRSVLLPTKRCLCDPLGFLASFRSEFCAAQAPLRRLQLVTSRSLCTPQCILHADATVRRHIVCRTGDGLWTAAFFGSSCKVFLCHATHSVGSGLAPPAASLVEPSGAANRVLEGAQRKAVEPCSPETAKNGGKPRLLKTCSFASPH